MQYKNSLTEGSQFLLLICENRFSKLSCENLAVKTNSNPYYENTVGINLNYISGVKQPSAMFGHQRINRTNPNANIDTLRTTIDSSLTVWDTTYLIQDARVDFIKTNNLFTLNIITKFV